MFYYLEDRVVSGIWYAHVGVALVKDHWFASFLTLFLYSLILRKAGRS